MSRNYRWTICIEHVERRERLGIEGALDDGCFPFGHLDFVEKFKELYGCSEWTIGGGKTEEEEERDICECVWRTVKRYVPITLTCLYLEDAPTYKGKEEHCKKVLEQLAKEEAEDEEE